MRHMIRKKRSRLIRRKRPVKKKCCNKMTAVAETRMTYQSA